PQTVEASVDKQEIPALRLAADPADDAGLAAARGIVDMLAADGIKAQVVTTDLNSAIAGNFDAIVAWTRTATDSIALADRVGCGVNLAKWCAEGTTEYINGVLAGEIDFDPAWEQQFNTEN